MSKLQTALLLLLVSRSSLLAAEPDPSNKETYIGEKAAKELQDFLSKRWYKQKWQIEYKAVEGSKDNMMWHIRQSPSSSWWVRLDGPEHLRQWTDLSKLDRRAVHAFLHHPPEPPPAQNPAGMIRALGALLEMKA